MSTEFERRMAALNERINKPLLGSPRKGSPRKSSPRKGRISFADTSAPTEQKDGGLFRCAPSTIGLGLFDKNKPSQLSAPDIQRPRIDIPRSSLLFERTNLKPPSLFSEREDASSDKGSLFSDRSSPSKLRKPTDIRIPGIPSFSPRPLQKADIHVPKSLFDRSRGTSPSSLLETSSRASSPPASLQIPSLSTLLGERKDGLKDLGLFKERDSLIKPSEYKDLGIYKESPLLGGGLLLEKKSDSPGLGLFEKKNDSPGLGLLEKKNGSPGLGLFEKKNGSPGLGGKLLFEKGNDAPRLGANLLPEKRSPTDLLGQFNLGPALHDKKSPLDSLFTPRLSGERKDLCLFAEAPGRKSFSLDDLRKDKVLFKDDSNGKDLGIFKEPPGRAGLGLFDPAPRPSLLSTDSSDQSAAATGRTSRRRGAPTLWSDSHIKLPGRETFLKKKVGNPDEQYDFIRKLGEGSFGITCLVKQKNTSLERCLKIVNKSKAQVPLSVLEKEFQALAHIDHPHVIRLFEYWEDNTNCYFVTEAYKGGTLLEVIDEHLRRRHRVDEHWLHNVFEQALEGIGYCHQHNIIHKDLKAENLMLLKKDDDPHGVHCVIIDLGLAECFDIYNELEVAGTPITMAPELWKAAMGLGTFGPKCDIYSLGCVLFRMLSKDGAPPVVLTGKRPPSDWLDAIKRGPDWRQIEYASRDAQDLVRRMLAYYEDQRPEAVTCLKHPWLNQRAPGGRTTRLHSFHKDALVAQGTKKRTPFAQAVLTKVASQMGVEELQDVTKVFRKYDKDDDGTLSVGDIALLLQDLGVSREAARDAAKSIDTSKDGLVNYTEFVVACISCRETMIREHLQQAFDSLDLDKDGYMTREDARRILMSGGDTSPYGYSRREADTLLEDMNVKSAMTFEEFADLFIPKVDG